MTPAGGGSRPAQPAFARRLTPPAAGCFSLVASPYPPVLSSLLALASFAGGAPGS